MDQFSTIIECEKFGTVHEHFSSAWRDCPIWSWDRAVLCACEGKPNGSFITRNYNAVVNYLSIRKDSLMRFKPVYELVTSVEGGPVDFVICASVKLNNEIVGYQRSILFYVVIGVVHMELANDGVNIRLATGLRKDAWGKR